MAYNKTHKLYHKIREVIYQPVKEEVEKLRIRYLCLAYLREKEK